jgi:hypothetical protein
MKNRGVAGEVLEGFWLCLMNAPSISLFSFIFWGKAQGAKEGFRLRVYNHLLFEFAGWNKGFRYP